MHVTECLVWVIYRMDWANFFSGVGGLPLAKIIGSSGVYPDHMFCNYNRLAMLGA